MENQDFYRNNVSSKGQVKNTWVTFGGDPSASTRVLFVGNSITRHAIAPNIGWLRDCGMAATCLENDYVHRTVAGLEKRYGLVSFCIAQLADWERDFENPAVLETFSEARDFCADIVIIRIGENVSRTVTDPAPLADAFEKMIRYFAVRPDCRVLVTDLFWSRTVVDSAIAQAQNRIAGCIPVHIGDLGADDSMKAIGEYEHQGVSLHPSDRGMLCIAERLLEKL